ncbi:protein Mis18-beta [Rhinatrema bivittatum]|uniref:protein Mis18-beta n=1 Tax=Rhinatrema bivittatum TaxID=194408 RepID=UPI00112A45D9|nr:protein Mis18-beta [Rhinatrema bivittatum]
MKRNNTTRMPCWNLSSAKAGDIRGRGETELASLGGPGRGDYAIFSGGSLESTLYRGVRLEELVVFQCRHCNAVLGDSLQLCRGGEEIGAIVCVRVTDEVICEDSLVIDYDGPLNGCSYHILRCRSCRMKVGFSLFSAFTSVAHLRELFCFLKQNIFCYVLKTKATVPASDLSFDVSSLRESLDMLKRRLVKAHHCLRLLTQRLEELTSKNNLGCSTTDE